MDEATPVAMGEMIAQLHQLARKQEGYGMSFSDPSPRQGGMASINLYGDRAKSAIWLFKNAAVIATALDDMQRRVATWVFPTSKADMPKKPGKAQYEYVECLVLYKGELLARPWNCEHEVFDDEAQDDHFCEWSEVTAYMDLTAIREAARQDLSDKTQEKNDG